MVADWYHPLCKQLLRASWKAAWIQSCGRPRHSGSDVQSFYSDGLRVWLFDGNITYFEGKHIILAIFGICFLSFLILPYIFLLLFGYRLQAYSGRKGFFWFNKFKPILDAYYAPYNSKNRYWPGFMLLVRGGVFLSSILIADTTSLLVVSSLFMAIGLVPWLRYPVYEKLYLDLLEASFILNIGILASATHHVKTVEGNQVLVTYLSVTVPRDLDLPSVPTHKGHQLLPRVGLCQVVGDNFQVKKEQDYVPTVE